MAMFSYEVAQVIYPGRQLRPFRIIERYPTCDGVRTRLTERCFKTLHEAIAECDRLESSQ